MIRREDRWKTKPMSNLIEAVNGVNAEFDVTESRKCFRKSRDFIRAYGVAGVTLATVGCVMKTYKSHRMVYDSLLNQLLDKTGVPLTAEVYT